MESLFLKEYWDGPKKLTATLNQLLGYSCWRDTKVAVIIFNRRKDFPKILDAIRIVREIVGDFLPKCTNVTGPLTLASELVGFNNISICIC